MLLFFRILLIFFFQTNLGFTEDVECSRRLNVFYENEEFSSKTRRTFLSSGFVIKSDKIKTAFFGVDKTLIKAFPVNGTHKISIIKSMIEPMKRLQKQGYLLALLSNEINESSEEEADVKMLKIVKLLKAKGINIHYYDFALKNQIQMKPDVGMATVFSSQIKEFGPRVEVNWNSSFVIGSAGYKKNLDFFPDGVAGTDEDNFDREFAKRLRIKFIHAKAFRGEIKIRTKRIYTPITEESFLIVLMNSLGVYEKYEESFKSFDKNKMVKDLLKIDSVAKDIEHSGIKFEASFNKIFPQVLGQHQRLRQKYHQFFRNVPFLYCRSKSPSSFGITFFIFWDGEKLRAFVPTKGNPWNRIHHRPYGLNSKKNDDKLDLILRYTETTEGRVFLRSQLGLPTLKKITKENIKTLLKNNRQIRADSFYSVEEALLNFKRSLVNKNSL